VKRGVTLAGTLAAASLPNSTPFAEVQSQESKPPRDAHLEVQSDVTIRRRIVSTPFGQVHVRTTEGRGLPPLLLLHMTPLSGAMFEEFMLEMGRERMLIAPDRVGYGASDTPRGDLSMEDYARATLAVLDALGCRTVDVFGIHTGSTEAVELAFAAPRKIRRVGVVGVPLFTEAEIAERRATRVLPPPPPSEDGSHLLVVWRRRFVYRHPPYDLPYLHWYTIEELKARPYAGLAYKAVYSYPMATRLKALTQPLIVFAAHDDAFEQTARSQPFLPPGAIYLDLPNFQFDIFHVKVKEMSNLVRRHFPVDQD